MTFSSHEEEMTCLHEAPRHVGDFKVVVMVDIRTRPEKNHAMVNVESAGGSMQTASSLLAALGRITRRVQRWQRRLARAATADGQDNFHDISCSEHTADRWPPLRCAGPSTA
jgi:hypothetical protein